MRTNKFRWLLVDSWGTGTFFQTREYARLTKLELDKISGEPSVIVDLLDFNSRDYNALTIESRLERAKAKIEALGYEN